MKRKRGHGDIEPDLGRLACFEADFTEGFELLDRRGDTGDQVADIELRYGLAGFRTGVFHGKAHIDGITGCKDIVPNLQILIAVRGVAQAMAEGV